MNQVIIQTDFRGKINHMPDFKDKALLPVFEAIINSIDAINERGLNGKGEINVKIIRETDFFSSEDISEDKKDERTKPKIQSFEIEDNGVGFTDQNYRSFNLADSTYKESLGGKGLGRFNWLKAFEKVEINSVYEENEERRVRNFDFSVQNFIELKSNERTNSDIKTTVKLIGFKEDYRQVNSAFKTAKKISQRILEHFLSYYIAEKAPSIIVKDGEETFYLKDDYNKIKENISQEEIEILGKKFLISHVKLFETTKENHNIVFCANERDVDSTSLEKLLGTSFLFDNNGNKFYYAAYVSSVYLNKRVDSYRNRFDIPNKGDGENLYGEKCISRSYN